MKRALAWIVAVAPLAMIMGNAFYYNWYRATIATAVILGVFTWYCAVSYLVKRSYDGGVE